MGELLVYCSQIEIVEAIKEYLLFEGLDYELVQLTELEALQDVANPAGLILQESTSNRKIIDFVRRIRSGSTHPYIPVLLLLQDLDPYLETICRDQEYVWPGSFPIDSADLVPGLRALIDVAANSQDDLKLRCEIRETLAENEFQRAADLIDAYERSSGRQFHSHLLRAKALFGLDQLKAAGVEAVAAMRIQPSSLEARVALAEVYRAANEREKALEFVSKCLISAPKHPPLLNIRGLLHLDNKEYDDAARRFELSLQVDAFQEDANAGMFVTEIMTGKMNEAKKRFLVFENHKNLIRYCYLRGVLMAKSHQFSDAQALIESVTVLIPGQREVYKVWLNMGLHAKRAGQLTVAEAFFRTCQKFAPAGYSKAAEQLAALKQNSGS